MRNFFRRRWYIVVIILVIFGLLFIGIRSASKSTAKKQTPYTVKRQDLKETLSLSGAIDAEEHIILRFQASGRLAWVGVKQGDYVKKNQAIASLDQREVQKNLVKALRDYSNTRWDFEQARQVTYKDVFTDTAKRILEQNQFSLDKAVMDVEIKQLAIEYATLISPIEGIVNRVASPYAGVNITPAQAEFEIVNPKTIYFSVTADQNDVGKLSYSKAGEVVLDAYPDTPLQGTIYMISFVPKTDETGTVYQVKLVLNEPNDDYRYRFGMTGDANFTVKEENNVLFVPTNYIKSEKGRKYVLKKSGAGTENVFIMPGDEIDGNTVVTSGLQESDIIYD